MQSWASMRYEALRMRKIRLDICTRCPSHKYAGIIHFGTMSPRGRAQQATIRPLVEIDEGYMCIRQHESNVHVQCTI